MASNCSLMQVYLAITWKVHIIGFACLGIVLLLSWWATQQGSESLDLVLLHATKTASMQMQTISNIRFPFNLESVNRIVLCLCWMEFLAWQKSRLQCIDTQKSLTEALQSWSEEWLLTAAACVLGHCTPAIHPVWTEGSLLPGSSHTVQGSSKIYLYPWVKRL